MYSDVGMSEIESRSLRGNVDRNVTCTAEIEGFTVVPYVGTWIEMIGSDDGSLQLTVVPYVGTWIEICLALIFSYSLKVVPYVGTWIEIAHGRTCEVCRESRSLRGNVDRNVLSLSYLPQVHQSFPTWERG